MLFKKNNNVDERIEKRENELCARMFPLLGVIELGFFVTKIACSLPITIYLLEIVTLAVGVIVWLVGEMRFGTLLVKQKDDILKELSNKAKTKAFMVMFWIVMLGEFLYFLLADEAYFIWGLSYFAAWVPCAIYMTIVSILEGLIIFGSKKKETNIKRKLAFRVVIGSIFFGLFVGFDSYYHDGIFNPKGLLAVFGLAIGWGVPFYLIFLGMMKYSEKSADKKIENVDGIDEK